MELVFLGEQFLDKFLLVCIEQQHEEVYIMGQFRYINC